VHDVTLLHVLISTASSTMMIISLKDDGQTPVGPLHAEPTLSHVVLQSLPSKPRTQVLEGSVGDGVGRTVGFGDGDIVGCVDGTGDGFVVGMGVGNGVGRGVGFGEGFGVGKFVGSGDGNWLGLGEGEVVGAGVGTVH
jgi:hypothetical protein